MKVAIIGAGIVGQLLAWHLCQKQVEIHLFTKGSKQGEDACSHMAAGMICPITEYPLIAQSWQQPAALSLKWWDKVISTLDQSVYYQKKGTLVIAHPQQQNDLRHFLKQCSYDSWTCLASAERVALEPELPDFSVCHFVNEAWVDPLTLFNALSQYLQAQGVFWHEYAQVTTLSQSRVHTQTESMQFDKVIDCRGMGAQSNIAALRGIRGELLYCYAKDVVINHMIRFIHPKNPCYIVPRPNQHYVIGATQIESENAAPISVRSVLHLLSSAVNVHPGFWDAEVVDMKSGIRPTMPDNAPVVLEQDGITYINGMFRHGFLLAPIISAQIADAITKETSLCKSPSTIKSSIYPRVAI